MYPGGSAGGAGGVNVYQYNNGNPVTSRDPMGTCPEDAGGDGKTPRYDDCPVALGTVRIALSKATASQQGAGL